MAVRTQTTAIDGGDGRTRARCELQGITNVVRERSTSGKENTSGVFQSTGF